MRCLLCGDGIKDEMPIPIKVIEFTPVIPYLPGVTANKLGSTVLTDRFCCQNCYKKVKDNDMLAIREVQISDAKKH